ncbi:MAG TPA: hypothetical protein VGT05_02825 [Patescibacteria group bacterium]|nr:hypothetical protein [Patescibacteria group bacterium]
MDTVRVGGAAISKNGNILPGKRKGKLGNGTWGFPGGKLEIGERWKHVQNGKF